MVASAILSIKQLQQGLSVHSLLETAICSRCGDHTRCTCQYLPPYGCDGTQKPQQSSVPSEPNPHSQVEEGEQMQLYYA